MQRDSSRLWIAGSMVVVTTLLAAEVILRQRATRLTWATPLQRLPHTTQHLRWQDVATSQRVVVLGDSIAAGSGLADGQAWPDLLARGLDREAGGPWRVINAGIPGETAAQGLLRVPRDVLAWQPHVVFIAFGLNDGHLAAPRTSIDAWRAGLVRRLDRQSGRLLLLDWLQRRFFAEPPRVTTSSGVETRLPLEDYTLALQLMLEQIWDTDPATRCVIVGLTPLDPAGAGGAAQAAVYDDYNRAAQDLAGSLSIPFVDLAGTLAAPASGSIWMPDGVHLTSRGQALIAQTVLSQWHAITQQSGHRQP